MLELLLVLTPISLIDSTSMMPFAVVVLAMLLSGPKPYLSSMNFVLGTALTYFAGGVLIAVGLGSLIESVSAALVHWWRNPSTLDYVLSLIVGVGLVFVGYRWAVARQEAKEKDAFSGVTPARAFLLGAGTTIVGLWGALPYFAAIDQILKADVSDWEAMIALAYYNLIFVAAMVLGIILRALLGKRADRLFDGVSRFFSIWGKRILIAVMVSLGLVMMADGVGFFFGHPLIPVDV